MKDLTRDSISIHIFTLAAPVMMLMLAYIAYQLVDLYFVTSLGTNATAGVTAAGGALLVVNASTQVLAVGTMPLVAHAVGAKDRPGANVAFNQCLLLSVLVGVGLITALAVLTPVYMRIVAADAATAAAGATFFWWMLPGTAAAFPTAVLTSSLRATGIISPTILISTLTVVINAALAPVLIVGWGTGVALGVAGAGMATSISALFGLILLSAYFQRSERYLSIAWGVWRPVPRIWRQVLYIGLPTSAEIVLSFICTAAVYYLIRGFGSATQAGYGVGMRVLQVLAIPGLAISFAVVPITAQNFGAKDFKRVRQTFRSAVPIAGTIMAAITVIVWLWAEKVVAMFARDPVVIAVAARFLQLMAWTFVAQTCAYICVSMFQGLGNTLPSLVGSGARFVSFLAPAAFLSTRKEFAIEQLWYLLIVSIVLQSLVTLWLLMVELKTPLLNGNSADLARTYK